MATRKIVSFDWAIKTILRDKANYDVLEGFLYALLKEKITILELIESESNQAHCEMKFNRVDLLAVNQTGEHIIIEVQYAPEQSYFKRLLYATSKDIVDNMALGDDYAKVKKVYSVSLIYFDVEVHEKHEAPIDYVYHGKVNFTGLHNGKTVKLDHNFLIGYDDNSKDDLNIFPEYFIIPINIFSDKVKDELDEWIYAFKHHEVKSEFSAPGIKKMGEKLDFVSMPPEQQMEYNKYLDLLASDRATLQFNAQKARNDGLRQGIEQGIEQGQHDIIISMASNGMTIQQIAQITGKPEQLIETIFSKK